MSEKTIFEVTEERFFERVVNIQDLVGEFETVEEVTNNLVLVDKNTLVQFTKRGPKIVEFRELDEEIQQIVLKDHIERKL